MPIKSPLDSFRVDPSPVERAVMRRVYRANRLNNLSPVRSRLRAFQSVGL